MLNWIMLYIAGGLITMAFGISEAILVMIKYCELSWNDVITAVFKTWSWYEIAKIVFWIIAWPVIFPLATWGLLFGAKTIKDLKKEP